MSTSFNSDDRVRLKVIALGQIPKGRYGVPDGTKLSAARGTVKKPNTDKDIYCAIRWDGAEQDTNVRSDFLDLDVSDSAGESVVAKADRKVA